MAERATRPLGVRLRPREQRAVLFIGDVIASYLAIFVGKYAWLLYSWYKLISSGMPPLRAMRFFPTVSEPFWYYFLPIIWLMLIIELYDLHVAASFRRTRSGIATAALVGFILYAVIFVMVRNPETLPRVIVGAYLALASLMTLGWRSIYIRYYTSPDFMRRILVIGAGKAGRTLVEAHRKIHPPPFQFVGFIDDDLVKVGKQFEGYPVFGSSEQLLSIIDEQKITDLVVGIMGEMEGFTFQTILDAQERGVEIVPMPTVYEEMVGRVPIHHLESDWILRSFVDQARVSGFYDLIKRFIDILGGLAGLVIFAVAFPFVAIATLIDSGWPIFYSQTRLGRHGDVFRISKFRTMYQNAEEDGKARLASENDPRITRVGNFLRKTRLDELPQFWTVLRGGMSLVGPRAERPELVAEFQKQIPFYRARLLVKPGLTGWAQINYGYVANVTETAVKLEYDLYYIKQRTVIMDIQIILRTVSTVFRGIGR